VIAHLLAIAGAPVLTHSADSGNGDPLYFLGLNWQVWLITIIKCLVAFVALLVATALMIWFERKVISDMQSRVGPNRAGPWGLLQTLADGTNFVTVTNAETIAGGTGADHVTLGSATSGGSIALGAGAKQRPLGPLQHLDTIHVSSVDIEIAIRQLPGLVIQVDGDVRPQARRRTALTGLRACAQTPHEHLVLAGPIVR